MNSSDDNDSDIDDSTTAKSMTNEKAPSNEEMESGAVPPTPFSKESVGSKKSAQHRVPSSPNNDMIPMTPQSGRSQSNSSGLFRDWDLSNQDSGNEEDDEDDEDDEDELSWQQRSRDSAGFENAYSTQELMLVRGTDIHIQTAAKAFQDFIRNFISLDQRQQQDTLSPPFYLEKLKAILLGNSNSHSLLEDDQGMRSSTALLSTAFIDLNTQHLFHFSLGCQKLYHQLVSSPTEVVPLMDIIVAQELETLLAQLHQEQQQATTQTHVYATLHPLTAPVPRTQVRPFYLKDLSYMRSLDPNSIDKLLSIRGMIVRSSPIIPDLKVAHFECSNCGYAHAVTLQNGRIEEPMICSRCNVRQSYQLIHNRCIFADKQMVRMQETPDEVPAGETPASIVLFAFDDLVDAVRPGDRVEVTGILRAQPRRVHPRITKLKTVYKTYLDVIHFRRISGTKEERNNHNHTHDHDDNINNDDDDDSMEQKPKTLSVTRGKGISVEHIGATFSKERMAYLQQMAQNPDIYEQLVQSLAPSIWGMDDVKKGVLCMLFGGNSRRVKKGTAARVARRSRTVEANSLHEDESVEDTQHDNNDTKLYKRGDINILLCGDPGTSKSQLLSYVHALSPRGVYTSGKGSSAVGLTASIVRDPETRELVLESGALVLSDLGICCIDEFDKMSDTTRAILHEAMEQQTVSIAKAGIIATLNSRTSILASANPVESRYNPQLSVVENIKLPPTLLSRFDLIYLILDSPNVESDRRLAQHLVGLYYDTPNVVQPPMDQNLLRDYIAYARDNIHPELSDLAERDLISAYLEMRSLGGSGGNGTRTISATPRQLESLIRLSEALAKMRYSTVVSRADVKEAVRLMRVATLSSATDPRTGKIDLDMITTGRTTVNREQEVSLNATLREMFATKRGNRMAVSDIRRELAEMINTATLNQDELVDALRRAEADGLIQFNERSQTIFVRAGML